MTGEMTFGTPEVTAPRRGRLSAPGQALLAVGILALAGQAWDRPSSALLFLPAVGLVFLLWGLRARNAAPLVPGGLLTGLGLGVYLVARPLAHLGTAGHAGALLLAIAFGWLLVLLLSVLVSRGALWWAIVPGGVCAIVGGLLLAGGLPRQLVLTVAGGWPAGLALLGLYLLARRRA